MSEEEDKEAKEKALENSKREIGLEELGEILGTTVKQDTENKIIAFIIMCGTYLGDEQSNVLFRAESSTGKSYIALELAEYFPSEDIVKIGSASPTAFFHDYGEFDKKRHAKIVDMEKKIYIFKDQPSTALMARLRSMLSHDEKELQVKFTDKTQKSGFRSRNVLIRGFPTFIVCTATKKIDLQESTRFFQLSPDVDVEKLEEAIYLTAKRDGHKKQFNADLRRNIERLWLKNRILDIKEINIEDVIISNSDEIAKQFISKRQLNPRHMRDFQRLLRLIKYWALLNFHNRKREGNTIYAEQIDIEIAYILYGKICEANELGISPEVYEIFSKIMDKLDYGTGMTKQDIFAEYLKVYKRPLSSKRLDDEIIPSLLAAGLIYWDETTGKGGKAKVFRLSKLLNGTQTEEISLSPQTKLDNPKNVQEKIKFLMEMVFMPNIKITMEQIQEQVNGNGISENELPKLLSLLKHESMIFEPSPNIYQRV